MRLYAAAAAGILAVVIAGACTDKLNRPSVRPEPEPEIMLVDNLFFSGMVFPEGYDWRSEEGSETKCKVILADLKGVIRSFPAGKGSAMLADPFMHLVRGGHIYDFNYVNGKTQLNRDAMALYSWDGEYAVIDVFEKDGHIHVLLSSAKRDEVVYCIDGIETVRSNGVGAQSGFYLAKGSLYYNLAGADTEKKTRAWYIVKDGEIIPVVNPYNDMDIIDVSMCSGMVCLIGNSKDKVSWVCGLEGRSALIWPKGERIVLKRLTHGDEISDVEGSIIDKDGLSEDVAWCGGDALLRPPVPLRRISSCPIPKGYYHMAMGPWILGQEKDSGRFVIFKDVVSTPLPDGYRPGPCPQMIFFGGTLYVPLVRDDGMAALLCGDRVSDLGFNGYLDHMDISKVEIPAKSSD